MSLTQVVAATPATRDRAVDFLRVAALGVVVLGHWLMAALAVEDGQFVGRNALETISWARWLTWPLQVMPIFFLVGGFSNSASWDAARRRGSGYGDWLAARLSRLLRPTVVMAATWIGVLQLARVAGVDPGLLHGIGRLAAMPLWFLAVYVIVITIAPVMVALHRAHGDVVPVALFVAAGTVDVAVRTGGLEWMGWANFALVWLLAHQLGIQWRDGRLRPEHGLRLLAAAAVALVVLVGILGYSTSMVGAWEGERPNTHPPSLALAALAVAQTGLVLIAAPSLRRWLARPRVWTATVVAAGVAMTVYLWHQAALVIGGGGLIATGVLPSPAIGSTAWWVLRPLWIIALAVVLVPIMAVFARFDRLSGRAALPMGVGRAVLTAMAASGGVTALVLGGFFTSGGTHGLPLLGGSAIAAATALSGASLSGSRRR